MRTPVSVTWWNPNMGYERVWRERIPAWAASWDPGPPAVVIVWLSTVSHHMSKDRLLNLILPQTCHLIQNLNRTWVKVTLHLHLRALPLFCSLHGLYLTKTVCDQTTWIGSSESFMMRPNFKLPSLSLKNPVWLRTLLSQLGKLPHS